MERQDAAFLFPYDWEGVMTFQHQESKQHSKKEKEWFGEKKTLLVILNFAKLRKKLNFYKITLTEKKKKMTTLNQS